MTLKRALQIASLTGIMLLVSVCSASADTLHYVVSGPLGSASFYLPQDPILTASSNVDFTVTVHNGSINLQGYAFSPLPPFDLEFSNASDGGGFALVVPILGEFQWKGAQMFSGSDSAPTLYANKTFLLDNGLVKVTVTAPEPSTLLLLSSALVGLGLFRKRRTST
jgi:hypothetical protein